MNHFHFRSWSIKKSILNINIYDVIKKRKEKYDEKYFISLFVQGIFNLKKKLIN